MANFKSIGHPLLNAFALIVAVGAVTVWSARLEHRVSGIEASLQALAAAPPAAQRPAMSAQEACANLALRVADAVQKPDRAGAEALRQLLRDAGCPPAAPVR
jgi:hypothetical protein